MVAFAKHRPFVPDEPITVYGHTPGRGNWTHEGEFVGFCWDLGRPWLDLLEHPGWPVLSIAFEVITDVQRERNHENR